MKRSITVALVVLLLGTTTLIEAVGSKKAAYIGGTVTGLAENAEGKLSTQAEDAVVFTPEKGQPVRITYTTIDSLEYGQKAGRRVGVAIMVSPLALFSKKRKHYLTVSYNDESGKAQAAVFELGKDIVRTTLTVLEVRSGKAIEYQDEEARKAFNGGK